MTNESPIPTKSEQIANALTGMINENDRFVVQLTSGKITVRSISDKETLKATNPDLHGKLLRYEQKFIGSGQEIWLYLFVAIILCVVVSQNYLRGMGIDLTELQSWWIYIAIVLLAFIMNNRRLTSHVAKQYAKHAASLKNDIQASGYSTEEVLSMISKDSSLFNVRQQLMMD